MRRTDRVRRGVAGLTGARALALALLMVAALTGCGEGDDPASSSSSSTPDRAWAQEHPAHELVSTALLAVQHERSVRIKAVVHEEHAVAHFDLTVLDEESCFGHVALPFGMEVDVVVRDGDGWERGPARTWRALARIFDGEKQQQIASQATTLAGKWVHTTGLAPICDLRRWITNLNQFNGKRLGEFGDVDGRPTVTVDVLALLDLKADATVWIDLAEPHHLLRASVTASGRARLGPAYFPDFESADFRLSEFGRATQVPMPPRADRIEVADLGPLVPV